MAAFFKEAAIVVVGALIASTLLRLFLLQIFVIPSRSMESTLDVHDRVAVTKIGGFQRGDVVVFRDDLEWLGNPDRFNTSPVQDALIFVGLVPDESSNHLVKRVIGLPGDHVTCCDTDGRLRVNGVALDESAYLYRDAATGASIAPSDVAFDVIVPAGRLFVLGDHRNNSADSRCHVGTPEVDPDGLDAFPRVDSVVGNAWVVVYPFTRWRGFGTPAVFAAVPAATGTPPATPVFVGPRPRC